MLINFVPNLFIPDCVLLLHFLLGFNKESALYLDLDVGGSFSHKDTMEGRQILNHFLDNNHYADYLSKQFRAILKLEETSTTEPKPLDSFVEPSPEPLLNPQLLEDEEIQPLKLPFGLPPKTEPLEKSFLETKVKDLTSILSDQWFRETKLSPVFQLCTPFSTISFTNKSFLKEALCNPTFGQNIMSALLASRLFFKSPSGFLLECKGVLCKNSIRLDAIEVLLDFHIFEIPDFDII